MRAIMNISLPAQMAAFIDTEVKSLSFSSRSEFIRKLIRDWQEKRILNGLERSEQDYNKGNYKVLNSLSELD